MSHIDVPHTSLVEHPSRPMVDTLTIMSCLPVLVIIATVLIIAGGVNLSFLIPAAVCGAMVGMLTFVSLRDRTRP